MRRAWLLVGDVGSRVAVHDEQTSEMRRGEPDGAICFEHTPPAAKLDREELEASVRAMLSTADEYDDRIVSEWGGVTVREKALNVAKEAGLVS